MTLEEAYRKPQSVKTQEIYRELAQRTGFGSKDLKNIFAVFYDIISEKIVEDDINAISFDNALRFKILKTPEKIVKNADDSLTVYPETLKVQVFLADKIKKAVVDLYDMKKDLD